MVRPRFIQLLALITLAVLAGSPQGLEAQETTISGVVKDAAGQPVSGAFVRVRSVDNNLSFLVVSREQGRYATPNLLPGSYAVESFGGGFQGKGTVQAASGRPATLDLSLSEQQPASVPRRRMLQADYERMLPDGDAKQLILSRCSVCHGLDVVAMNRGTREEWEETVDLMQFYMEERRIPFTAQDKAAVVDYASAHFGSNAGRNRGERANDPNKHLPRTLLGGTAAKFVAMEFALTPGAGSHDISVDSQGNAWVSERGNNLASISKFDPKALSYTRIPPPPGKVQPRPSGITVDPRDMVWAIDNSPNNRMIAYDTKNREFSTFDIPAPPRQRPAMNTVRYKDGVVWGSGIASSQVYRLDPNTRKVDAWPVPKGSHPYGLAHGNDGDIWYVAQYADSIGKLDPSTGEIEHHKVPQAKSDLRRAQTDNDGNLWAGGHESMSLIRVDAKTGVVTEFQTPTEVSGPYSVDVDRSRNLIWVGYNYGDKLGRFDPRTNTWTEFPLPRADSDIRRIEVDQNNPNRVWWAGNNSARIGYVEVLE
jgi:virginiamycin B lyase